MSESLAVTRRTPLIFVLLLALAAALLLYGLTRSEPRSAMLVQGGLPELPDVVAPEGLLLEVFKAARPATLQIEISSASLAVESFPLGVGTGFFISPDGLVLTAYHVVDPGPNFAGVESLVARSPSGARYPLRLIGFDAYRDLAVLQAVGAEDVPYLGLEAEPPKVGEGIVAIGNSRNAFLEARAGVIRRLDAPAVQMTFADGTVEISAALAPGDSGGPVLSERGSVLGVVSYIAFLPTQLRSQPGMFPLLGASQESSYAAYAVPVAADSAVLAALQTGERRDIPVIGFQVGLPGLAQNYIPGHAEFDLGRLPGVVVGQVTPGGPAAQAGLRDALQRQINTPSGALSTLETRADVVVAVDGERTPTFDDLQLVLRRRQVGERVEVEVQRGDQLLTLELELGGKRDVFGG